MGQYFAVLVELEVDYTTADNERLLLVGRLSQIIPIACLRWMVTNSRSAFAELDPPPVIIESYYGTVAPELEAIAKQSRDILRRHGYLTVELDDLNFTVVAPREPAADARPITGASFFFGWDFLRGRSPH